MGIHHSRPGVVCHLFYVMMQRSPLPHPFQSRSHIIVKKINMINNYLYKICQCKWKYIKPPSIVITEMHSPCTL